MREARLVREYRSPEVVDYGDLVRMTASVHLLLGNATTNDLSFSTPTHSTMGGGGGSLPAGAIASGAGVPAANAGPHAIHGHLADTSGGGGGPGTVEVGGVGAGPGGGSGSGGSGSGSGGGGGGQLPFTGFVAAGAALLGTGLAASGAALRRALGKRRGP